PPRALLAGQTTGEGDPAGRGIPPWGWWLAGGAALGGVVGGGVGGGGGGAGAGGGAVIVLVGAMSAGAAGSGVRSRGAVRCAGCVGGVGGRNAAGHPGGGLLTVGLLGSAAFVLVAVESFRRQARPGAGDINAPDGGFRLLAESDLPLVRDPASAAGRREIL